MEFSNCDVLNLSYDEFVCFQQQKANEKYKKKVNDVSYERPKRVKQEINCTPCEIYISGWFNYQKHVNSIEHTVKVQKKYGSSRSSYVASIFDLKTQRNQPEEYSVSLNSPTKAVAPAVFRPCQKQFSGPENYDHHLESTDHRKKCGPSTQILQNDETDSIVIKDNMNDILPNYPLSSVSTSKVRDTVTELFVKCDTCEIEFSGDKPYLIHLVSNGHKMKASNRRQSEFKCDICVMTFTDDVQYEQHLLNNGHKKNITAHLFKQLPGTEAISPLDSPVKDSYKFKDLEEWYCRKCKKKCYDLIAYLAHITSQEHEIKFKIMLLEEFRDERAS